MAWNEPMAEYIHRRKIVRNEAPEKSAKKNNYGINSMYVSNIYT